MKRGDHRRPGYARDHAFVHRRGCCDAQIMAVQASFAKKVARLQYSDDGFLSLLGNHRELDLAPLDVKDSVRDVALGEDNLTFLESRYRFSVADFGEKRLGIKKNLASPRH